MNLNFNHSVTVQTEIHFIKGLRNRITLLHGKGVAHDLVNETV